MQRAIAIVFVAVGLGGLVSILVWWHAVSTTPADPIPKQRSWTLMPPPVDEVPAPPPIRTYAGRRDPEGNFDDSKGAYAGRRDSTGAYFDSNGTFIGRIDSTSNYYDATGTYAGRLNDDGSYFGPTGAYAGRVDGQGSVYEREGGATSYNGSCDDACKQDTVSRLLLAR